MLAVWKRVRELAHREKPGRISICNLFFSMGHQKISKQMGRREIPVLVNTFKYCE